MTRPGLEPFPEGPGHASPTGTRARPRGTWPRLWPGALAAALASGLFLIDALTRLEGAVAVLYVVVILVVARSFGRTGILVASGCCIALTAAAYVISQGMLEGGEPLLRCIVSLCAIGTAAALVLRNHRADAALVDQAELLELAHDPIFASDADRRIVFWNKSAEDLYGWSKAEALGQSAHRLLETSFPVDLSIIEAELARAGRWEGGTRPKQEVGRADHGREPLGAEAERAR